MADKDITVWQREDDVRQSGLDRLPCAHLVTVADLGIEGDVAEAYRQTQFESGKVANAARWNLDLLYLVLLNLMRVDSGLEFTAETNPNKWAPSDLTATIVHTRKKRKRVAGTGQGQASADNFVYVDVIDREEGWGNDYVAARNPTNSEGVQNAIEPRPGWAYRMVFDERNRETVLRALKFWDPKEVGGMVNNVFMPNEHRLAQLLKDPKRQRSLEIVAQAKEALGGEYAPESPMRDALAVETVEAIQRDLANKMGTQKDIAERHGVSIGTVSRIATGKYKTAAMA